MAFFRGNSQFFRHVVVPFFYYLGIGFLVCFLIFLYYVLKNSAVSLPSTVKVIEVGPSMEAQSVTIVNPSVVTLLAQVDVPTSDSGVVTKLLEETISSPPRLDEGNAGGPPPVGMFPQGNPGGIAMGEPMPAVPNFFPAQPDNPAMPPAMNPPQGPPGFGGPGNPHLRRPPPGQPIRPADIMAAIRDNNLEGLRNPPNPLPGMPPAAFDKSANPAPFPLAGLPPVPAIVARNAKQQQQQQKPAISDGQTTVSNDGGETQAHVITEKDASHPVTPEMVPFNYLALNKTVRKARPGRGEPGSDSYYIIPEQLNTIVKVNKTAYKSRTCSVITGRRILINYAHNCCKHSQPLNCETGLKHGFDICIQFTQESIDPFFLKQNARIFREPIMAGYGIWKSFLIMRLLMTLDDDDVLFYSDSGAKFIDSPEDYFCLMDERNQDTVVFSVGLPEDLYTKGDAFLIAGCVSEECRYSQQRLGGYSIYRKSMVSFHFLATWLAFNQDLRLVSDYPSLIQKNLPTFRTNRHDQTALSLASKRCGIPEWPDPSQWGENGWNEILRARPEFKKINKTIILCTRDKS